MVVRWAGFLAFHLGNKFGIKTLLLNPALADLKDIEKPKVELIENTTVKHLLVLGKKDEIVPVETTLNFLKKHRIKNEYYIHGHEHRTPFKIYLKYVTKMLEQD